MDHMDQLEAAYEKRLNHREVGFDTWVKMVARAKHHRLQPAAVAYLNNQLFDRGPSDDDSEPVWL